MLKKTQKKKPLEKNLEKMPRQIVFWGVGGKSEDFAKRAFFKETLQNTIVFGKGKAKEHFREHYLLWQIILSCFFEKPKRHYKRKKFQQTEGKPKILFFKTRLLEGVSEKLSMIGDPQNLCYDVFIVFSAKHSFFR